MGFTICESDHAECRGVYIFDSEYWGEKIEIEFFEKKSNRNRVERKTTIVTSLYVYIVIEKCAF